MRSIFVFVLTLSSIVYTSCRAITPEQTAELYAAGSDQPSPGNKGPFVLVVPERIEKEAGGSVVIHYKAPCENVEFASRVTLTNDSGDRTIYLGVVYEDVPRQCQRGPLKDFEYRIDSTDPVYAVLTTDVKLAPVTNDYVLAGTQIVKKISTDKIGIDFEVPCSSLDFESIVTSFDDSGDFIISVGIVYDRKYCKTGENQTIQREFDRSEWPELFAELGVDNDDVSALPMKVH